MNHADKVRLARSAAKTALQFRVRNGVDLENPCDIYDLIPKNSLQLQFMDVPSLEGMYLNEPETQRICVCGDRPVGRQHFTAAHELGHHVMGHGTTLDMALEYNSTHDTTEEEYVADAFARFLLMPPRAVQRGFRARRYNPCDPTAEQIYHVACWLGVGYGTLIEQLRFTLEILPFEQYKRLKKVTPKSLKSGVSLSGAEIWCVDKLWAGMRLRAKVGDRLSGIEVATATSVLRRENSGFIAAQVGEISATITDGGEKILVAVSRQRYVGFAEYMYLED